MDEQFKAKLLSYMDKVEAAAQKVSDFAETEVPEAIKEWLTWLCVERFSYAAAFLVGAVVVGVVARKLWRQDFSVFDDAAGITFRASRIASLALWLIFPILMAASFTWAMSGVKVLVAPRVVLVEEVAKLVKDVKK